MIHEPTKQNFIRAWGLSGYRENFDVYSMADRGGVGEKTVVDGALRPYFNRGHVCLEIGCGGGYWSRNYLSPNFKSVIGLDVVPVEGDWPANFRFIEVPNRDYSCFGVQDESVDFVWSFGVFCHLRNDCTWQYVKSAYRVLKPGGRATLYFANSDRRPGCATVGGRDDIIWADMTTQDAYDVMWAAGFVDIVDAVPDARDTILTGLKPLNREGF
jgi:SAM-dependent methyltransferase